MIHQPDTRGSSYGYGAPAKQVNTIATEKICIDRKIFFIDLQENHRGRYFKVTEDVNGRRDTIIIPVEAAESFVEALQRIVQVSNELGED